MRDDVVEEEDAAKGDLAGDHIALHVYAQLPPCILLIHLHVPARGMHALASARYDLMASTRLNTFRIVPPNA